MSDDIYECFRMEAAYYMEHEGLTESQARGKALPLPPEDTPALSRIIAEVVAQGPLSADEEAEMNEYLFCDIVYGSD